MHSCDVAIIGAGPYGLSIAAHLRAAGVNFRIFGEPMGFWLKHMPRGMHLKSEGFASCLYEPSGAFTLGSYCQERGISYADIGSPVPLEVFASYGLEFQRRFVPELENEKVVMLRRSGDQFRLTLEKGETVAARRVVVAVGQTYYAYLPDELAGLPREFVTHSSEHSTLDRFSGKQVAILGAGASALDLAALLHEAGARVQVLARTAKIRYHDPIDTSTPSWSDRILKPVTGIGPGWKLWLCTNLPLVFRLMPASFRVEKVRQILGPAPCWFIRERVVGKVELSLGVSLKSVRVKDGRLTMELLDSAGSLETISPDHLIAATGFRSDLRRLGFLGPEIAAEVKCLNFAPVLSSNFESTVPNLYFVGVTAANTFGPLLRFAFGAGFAAPRISRHLRRSAVQVPVAHRAAMPSEVKRESVEPAAR